MAGLMYIPQRQNQMFSVLSNLMFQKMAHKQRMEIADKQIAARTVIDRQEAERAKFALDQEKLYDARLLKDKNEREDKKEVRDFKKKGWTEAEAEKPAVSIGDVGLVPPPEEAKDDWGPMTTYTWGDQSFVGQVNRKNNTIRKIESGKVAGSATEAELAQRAAMGDKKAQGLLGAINKQAENKATAQAEGKIKGLLKQMGGADGVAKGVIEGRIDWGKIKNTFGVPMIEIIRAKILEKDKNFDFITPTAVYKSLTASLGNQEKQRGMMQSFVQNINAQVDRVGERMKDIGRWDLRALDIPRRALAKRFMGSGKEAVLEAYLTEISNEINKLSQGSQASIAQLGEESQKRWNAIHDPNLSLKELRIILDETKNMANMRMKSVSDTIEMTKVRMQNVMKPDRASANPTEMTDDELLRALNE